MRRDIVHSSADELKYEIREIVLFAREVEKFGIEIIWENIGDPVQKGERLPDWIKQIVSSYALKDLSYAYTDTQGIPSTRKFLAEQVNQRGQSGQGVQIDADDIVFFNGLGDAVAKVFGFLKREARVLGPSPAYSTLSSAEAAHSGYHHMTYTLEPSLNWQPDMQDVENKVKYNDAIAGILLINPDNPTGAVYPEQVLRQFVRIAREYDLFLIADETYANITYNGAQFTPLSEVLGSVPGMALRSISKDFPWPGARCGWMEVYNQAKDANFARYIKTIVDAKRLEVCSTALPQMIIPEVLADPRFSLHLKRRAQMFGERARQAYETFLPIEQVSVSLPGGALYFTVVFKSGVLEEGQSLPVTDPNLKAFIEQKTRGQALDKCFAYWLLANSGICVVPLSGFACAMPGFRLTLLETDDQKRQVIWTTVADAIRHYLSSCR